MVSRLTPVASLTRVTLTPFTTAPVGSTTLPRTRPPVLWANEGRMKKTVKSSAKEHNSARRTMGEYIDASRLLGRSVLVGTEIPSCKPCYNSARLVGSSQGCQAKTWSPIPQAADLYGRIQ